MNMNNLYYFSVLARFEHYARASEYLYITQPSLSHAISSLETEYGVKLFEKDGRNVRLSKYGKLLYSYTSSAFAKLNQGNHILSQFSSKEKGIVDFSFLFIFGYKLVPDLIKSFQRSLEHQQITINLKQLTSTDSIKYIKSGDIDIALCTYIKNEPDIHFTPLFEQKLVCIVPQEHPLSHLSTITINQIAGYPILQYTDTVGDIQEIITNLFSESNLEPNVYMRLQEEVTMAGFIAAGIAGSIAVVPDLEILNSFNIKKIPINNTKAQRTIYLAQSKSHPLPECVKEFYNYTYKLLIK